jgi:hypothetical protein
MMVDVLTPEETVEDVSVTDNRIDALIRQAEELCTLSLERTMFTPTEVMDLTLDIRTLLSDIKDALEPVPA